MSASAVFDRHENTVHFAPHLHSVQFYEGDAVLLDGLVPFVGSALGAGQSAIVIATKAHRDGLTNVLRAAGFDVSVPVSQGRFVQLDATETLAKFMVDGWPDGERFKAVIGAMITQLAATATGGSKQVAAFGEMVALLWNEGNPEAAIRLEQLWNELAQTHAFRLHCAYPIQGFSDSAHGDMLKSICAEHSDVVPTESFTALQSEEERLRAVTLLQQKAQALEALALERERLAQELAEDVGELRRLHELATRMSWLDLNAVMTDVLQSVTALHKTDMGLLSLHDPSSNDLHPGASVGFQDSFLAEIARVPAGAGACGTCLQDGRRVIIRDTETDPIFAGFREAARTAGFRAVHSTPLGDRSGRIIGVLSVHFREPHEPSLREQRLTDLYARLAVSAIENARLYTAAQEEFKIRKQTQDALIQAEKLAATGRLAATIAHEINNPLEAVTNYLYLARKHPQLPESVRMQLNIVDEEINRVAHIAQQTLGFYRDNSQPYIFNVAKTIEDVLTIYERKLEQRRITVQREFTENLQVRAFRGELKQVLSNLIANAIDATAEGGRLRIRSSISTNSHARVRISVADTGSGMSREVRQKLFTPFFTTKQQVGTGLGLWTTKNLLEKQGGKIRMRSVEGRGTVVTVLIPPGLQHETCS